MHPERMLDAQLWQVASIGIVAFVGDQQLDHQAEERRLRAAEVVAAVAIGDVPVAVQLPGEVVDHVAHLLPATTGGEAEQGEVAVPVVNLTEAATRYHVGVGEWQQRAMRIYRRRLPGQHRPQSFDVHTQALARGRHVGRCLARHVERG
ncbi:hypothetical protein D3C73_1125230 [compost metagenome]